MPPAPEVRCKNPLLLTWVKEWVDEARERNSKGYTTYNKAYKSLQACPITMQHPSQLEQLRGFGPKLCSRLTDKMKLHCEENGLPMPKRPRSKDSRLELGDGGAPEDGEAEARPAKKARKAKPYVPVLRSGAYALILGLAERDAAGGLTKNELIQLAQPHCDSSFSAPSDPTSFYTAWNSMKLLKDKDLVYERPGPTKRFSLTEEGWEVAERIRAVESGSNAVPAPRRPGSAAPGSQVSARTTSGATASAAAAHALPSSSRATAAEPKATSREDDDGQRRASRSPSLAAERKPMQSQYADVVADRDAHSGDALPSFRPIRLAPGSFTVHLVLDVREVRAKTDRDYMQIELSKKGVTPITRSLELGDALWVAKCHDPTFLERTGAEGDEVVLDFIAERKRLDDLIYSIKDGRFREQKFRLQRSGVRNVIYIIEEMSLDAGVKQKYEESIDSAIASTQVVNGYTVKKTQKMDDTIRYLARLTTLLKKKYEDKSLFVIPTDVLTAKNYLPLLSHLRETSPSMSHHISYPAFASLASKSELMTLRDLYLKMLMCTAKVTGDKAIEIQKRWTTPNEFIKAFVELGSGPEGQKRKRELVAGQMSNLYGNKKIAKTLSQKIAEVWGDA